MYKLDDIVFRNEDFLVGLIGLNTIVYQEGDIQIPFSSELMAAKMGVIIYFNVLKRFVREEERLFYNENRNVIKERLSSSLNKIGYAVEVFE